MGLATHCAESDCQRRIETLCGGSCDRLDAPAGSAPLIIPIGFPKRLLRRAAKPGCSKASTALRNALRSSSCIGAPLSMLLRARPASLSCTRMPFLLLLLEPRSRRCRCAERAASGREADKRRGLLSMRTAPSGGRRRSGPGCSQPAQRTNAQSRGLFGRPATCSGSWACWVCALTVTLCFTRSALVSRLMASCHV